MLSSLNSLKTKVDKLHIDRLKPFLVDLITLSNVVEEEVIKKTVFEFLLNRLMNWLKKLMLLMLVNLTKRIIMLRSKILKINTQCYTNLATTAAFSAVENKIPNVCDSLKTNRI